MFQAEDGIRDAQESRGLGDVYKRQAYRIPVLRFITCVNDPLIPPFDQSVIEPVRAFFHEVRRVISFDELFYQSIYPRFRSHPLIVLVPPLMQFPEI
mgnify:CR=1 FL=1